jgi:undecaprenyl-diphosphatase
MTLASIDTSWYRDVNEFARDTPWAHGVLAAYANWAGLVLLAALLILGWLLARRRADAQQAVATAFLTGIATLLALLANQAIGRAVARTRPCHSLHRVECCSPARRTTRSRATTA